MLKKKYIIGILLAVLMTCAVVSAMDTVSAAKYKKIDEGKNTVYDSYNNEYVTKWYAKSNGKVVKTSWKLYAKVNNKNVLYSNWVGSHKKTSKKVLKSSVTYKKTKYMSRSKKRYQDKTTLSANKFYMKKLKPIFKNPT